MCSEIVVNFCHCLSWCNAIILDKRFVCAFITEKYWKEGTSHALLFYTGNEGPIEQFWDNTGFIFEAAEQLNALVIFGEHVSWQLMCS